MHASQAPVQREDRSVRQLRALDSAILPEIVLLQRQPQASLEARTLRIAVALADRPIQLLAGDRTAAFAEYLRAGTCLPVGSVEFIRSAMESAGLREPAFSCYPKQLESYLSGAPRRSSLGKVLASKRPVFLKPVRLKVFDGFVYRPGGFDLDAYKMRRAEAGSPDAAMEASAEAARYAERLRLLREETDPSTPVWYSDPVSFASEWRYYLMRGELIGYARYDDGPDDAPSPSDLDVTSMVADAPPAATCSLDVGVMADGSTCLIECNDAWALGYYRGEFAPTPQAYLCMLWTRWQQLLANR